MKEPATKQLNRLSESLRATVHAHWKLFLLQAVVMMMLGVIAVAAPQVASLAISILIGWLFFIGGLFRALIVFQTRKAPGFRVSMLTALLALVLGLILISQPVEGVLTLTMALILLFLVEGIGKIAIALAVRGRLRSWLWPLFSGLVDLLLAWLIWEGWPDTAAWAMGLLVGINMIVFGLSLAMIALSARSPEAS